MLTAKERAGFVYSRAVSCEVLGLLCIWAGPWAGQRAAAAR